MNPLRKAFLCLAKMPPVVMLLIIIGMAVVTTMVVTGAISDEERLRQPKDYGTAGHQIADSEARSPVIVAARPIQTGSHIEKSMIEQVRLPETVIWQDALTVTTNAVGRTAKRAIPAYAQIREVDLE